ncbi:butyrophilin subfamily 1 member A1-like [Colossoma macropomum]|uniref:butyrophilin subfamily 1 member A1-like n=1 Tax=Colossoma macropomum TaxID=42526 RepID=UPI0018641E32|nr:butyrophilin subfamily 1 member A1-like [Colossoma macropomum]
MLVRWTWLVVFLSSCDGKGLFSVVAPQAPVAGLLGSSVSLPCTLSPTLNAVTFEVLWYRPNEIGTPVLSYKNQKIQENPRDPRYWGRVSLSGGLEKGNVSLKLENFTLADKGYYICRVEKTEEWYDEATVSLQEKVTGSPPVLSVADAGEGQMNVSCHSDGWSPEPSLSWTDREGQDLKYLSKSKFIKDSEWLVSVSSWLLVSSSESEWLSCSVGFF